MKHKLIVLAIALSLVACSSTPKRDVEPGGVTALNTQTLDTTFKREKIKIEWDCVWGTGLFDATCVKTAIKSIEVTGYAPSFGNSEILREQAFKVAHDDALDRLIRFTKQDITSNRVIHTLTKNIEKAQDKIKQHIKSDDNVAMSDDEASKEPNTNVALRERNNSTVRTITETVRTNAQGIIRGARAIDEKIVDKQTVAVTLRWDTDSERAAQYLRKHFVTN